MEAKIPDDRSKGKKRHRSPPPKLAPLKPLLEHLTPKQRQALEDYFIQNFVSGVVDEYMAEVAKEAAQHQEDDEAQE